MEIRKYSKHKGCSQQKKKQSAEKNAIKQQIEKPKGFLGRCVFLSYRSPCASQNGKGWIRTYSLWGQGSWDLCRGGIQPPSISQSDCVFLKMHSRSLEPSSIGFFCAIFDLQLLSMCPVSHLFDDWCQVALYDLYAWTWSLHACMSKV